MQPRYRTIEDIARGSIFRISNAYYFYYFKWPLSRPPANDSYRGIALRVISLQPFCTVVFFHQIYRFPNVVRRRILYRICGSDR